MNGKAMAFWKWFQVHHQSYLFMNNLPPEDKQALLNQLLGRLQEYCPHLGLEIGGKPNEKQELIITAEGDADYFNEAMRLVAVAPKMSDWKFIALVPPRGAEFQFAFEDIVLKVDDIWFQPVHDSAHPDAVGIRVCMPYFERLKELEWFRPAVYNILENILGERSFALDLQYIEIGSLPGEPEEKGMEPLSKLPGYVDWAKLLQRALANKN